MLHNLRTAILERFGTQLKAGAVARVHPVRLNRIVRGHVRATAEEKERLATALQAESNWLFADVRVASRRADSAGAVAGR